MIYSGSCTRARLEGGLKKIAEERPEDSVPARLRFNRVYLNHGRDESGRYEAEKAPAALRIKDACIYYLQARKLPW